MTGTHVRCVSIRAARRLGKPFGGQRVNGEASGRAARAGHRAGTGRAVKPSKGGGRGTPGLREGRGGSGPEGQVPQRAQARKTLRGCQGPRHTPFSLFTKESTVLQTQRRPRCDPAAFVCFLPGRGRVGDVVRVPRPLLVRLFLLPSPMTLQPLRAALTPSLHNL